jgi:hypothetical protein
LSFAGLKWFFGLRRQDKPLENIGTGQEQEHIGNADYKKAVSGRKRHGHRHGQRRRVLSVRAGLGSTGGG